jgi:hypothetical protein
VRFIFHNLKQINRIFFFVFPRQGKVVCAINVSFAIIPPTHRTLHLDTPLIRIQLIISHNSPRNFNMREMIVRNVHRVNFIVYLHIITAYIHSTVLVRNF